MQSPLFATLPCGNLHSFIFLAMRTLSRKKSNIARLRNFLVEASFLEQGEKWEQGGIFEEPAYPSSIGKGRAFLACARFILEL